MTYDKRPTKMYCRLNVFFFIVGVNLNLVPIKHFNFFSTYLWIRWPVRRWSTLHK